MMVVHVDEILIFWMQNFLESYFDLRFICWIPYGEMNPQEYEMSKNLFH